MALPDGVKTVRVTFGPYVDFQGTPKSGTVTFTPPTGITHLATGSVLFPDPVVVELSRFGAGKVDLPATDQDGLNVSDFTYEVCYTVPGTSIPVTNIALPEDQATVDLDTLVPIPTSEGFQVAVPLVRSVDGQTGHVELDYVEPDELEMLASVLARKDTVPPLYDARFAKVDAVPPFYRTVMQTIASFLQGGGQVLATESGYVLAFVDQAGRLVFGIRNDGVVEGKLFAGAKTIGKAQLTDDVTNRLGQDLAVESGAVYALLDAAGRAALEVTPDGTVRITKVQLAPDSIGLSELKSEATGTLPQTIALESGYSYVVTDQDGRFGFGLRPDGTFDAQIGVDPSLEKFAYAATASQDGNSVVTLETYGDGQHRLLVTDLTTGDALRLTDGFDDYDPQVSGAQVHFRRRREDLVAGSVYEPYVVPVTGGAAQLLQGNNNAFAAWGDSITAGAGGGGTTYENVLSGLLGGKSVANLGVGGETAAQIAARANGTPVKFTLVGDAIPASDPVEITTVPDLPSPQASQSWQGTLAGVKGTFSKNSGVKTFTRLTAGDVVPVPPGTPFFYDTGAGQRASVALLWLGRNGVGLAGTTTTLLTQSIIDYQTPFLKRYLVLSVLNGGTEVYANSGIKATNDSLAAAFGTRYLDIRRYLVTNGLQDAGITPTAQDNTDIANDVVPSSLRVDGIHLNAAGYTVVGQQVYAKLLSKGWA